MTVERILVIDDDSESVEFLLSEVLSPHGYVAYAATDSQAGLSAAQEQRPDLVLLDLGATDVSYPEMLQQLQLSGDPPVIVLTPSGTEAKALHAIRLGARDALIKPFGVKEMAEAIGRVLHQERLIKERDWLVRTVAGSNEGLEEILFETQTLYDIGKEISSSLDLETVLTIVVRAAIAVSGAEEGYLLLTDPENNELWLRAIQNPGKGHADILCVRVDDGIARQVMRTGEPVALSSDGDASIKIGCKQLVNETDRLVRSLVNVPLFNRKQVVGILGVDNVLSDRSFAQSDVMLLSALADSASIAIQNAQVYGRTDETLGRMLAEVSAMQYKTDLILRNISEGVYTVNEDLCITSANPAMECLTGWQEYELLGRRYDEVFAPQANGRRLSPEQTVPGKALRTQSRTASDRSTILRKDNQRVLVAGTGVPLRATGASVSGVLATMRDLTPEVKLNQVRHEMRAKLRSRDLRLYQNTEGTLDEYQPKPDKAPFQYHPVALRPIIAQVIKSFQGIAPENLFQVTLAPDLPFAIGDENKIELALVNLIDNALILANSEHPISISADASDNSVVIVVEGPDLANEEEEYVQLLFHRHSVDEQDTRNATHLPWWTMPQIKFYIARKLIQAQGGQVWTESGSVAGTRFHFSLPKFEVQDVAEALID